MSTRSRKQKKDEPQLIKSLRSRDVKVQDKSTLQSFKGKPPTQQYQMIYFAPKTLLMPDLKYRLKKIPKKLIYSRSTIL